MKKILQAEFVMMNWYGNEATIIVSLDPTVSDGDPNEKKGPRYKVGFFSPEGRANITHRRLEADEVPPLVLEYVENGWKFGFDLEPKEEWVNNSVIADRCWDLLQYSSLTAKA